MTNFHGDEAKKLLAQGPIHEIFTKKYWELTELKNDLFLSRPFWIFFLQRKKKFASYPWKSVKNYVLEWMGLNFQYHDGLQPKIRAGIINEHECTWWPSYLGMYFYIKKFLHFDIADGFVTFPYPMQLLLPEVIFSVLA